MPKYDQFLYGDVNIKKNIIANTIIKLLLVKTILARF